MDIWLFIEIDRIFRPVRGAWRLFHRLKYRFMRLHRYFLLQASAKPAVWKIRKICGSRTTPCFSGKNADISFGRVKLKDRGCGSR